MPSLPRSSADSDLARRRYNRQSTSHKICNTCHVCKPLADYNRGGGTSGTQNRCRDCRRDIERASSPRRDPGRGIGILAAGAKACSACGDVKPLDDFPVARRASDGRSASCRLCKSERDKAYWARVKSERNAASLQRSRTDPEYRERRLAAVRKFNAAHRDGARDRARARKALVRGGGGGAPFSKADIWERDGGRCHICGKLADPKSWHLDHLVPVSLGGAHCRENVAVSHPFCNIRRHNRGPAQLRLIG